MTDFGRIPPELAEAQDRVEEERNRLDESLQRFQDTLHRGREDLKKIGDQARKVDALVQEFPIGGFGVFLAAGFVLGGMIARRQEARLVNTEALKDDLSKAIEKGLERSHADRPIRPVGSSPRNQKPPLS